MCRTNSSAAWKHRIAICCSSGGDSVEDHTEGFRKSSAYQEWKRLLHHFYDPFHTVEHYELVAHSSS